MDMAGKKNKSIKLKIINSIHLIFIILNTIRSIFCNFSTIFNVIYVIYGMGFKLHAKDTYGNCNR